MKKAIKVLLFLTSMIYAEEVTFTELVRLASQDVRSNIYLDKDIQDYKVEFNIVDHQEQGEVYEFLKVVLYEHDMYLQYNNQGKFYFIKQNNKIVEPLTLDPLPLIPDNQKTSYYSYKIKNITNDDVVKVMTIFQDELNKPIRYTYLAQSDIIAYSATKAMHKKIKKMLVTSDNTVKQVSIKITLFSVNNTKIKAYGSSINSFTYDLDSTLNGVLSALKNGQHQKFSIKDSFNFGITLTALQSRGLADIYQEPTIYLTNGIETSINFVKNVAYKESTTTFKENTSTTSDQIKYRDIGFKVKVLPKIKDNWVFLNLSLISEELLSLNDNIPLTEKISYQSKIKIYKGKPILLTGLKKSSKKYERSGIPILSDIPIIGELFKSRRTQNEEQTVNILIEVL